MKARLFCKLQQKSPPHLDHSIDLLHQLQLGSGDEDDVLDGLKSCSVDVLDEVVEHEHLVDLALLKDLELVDDESEATEQRLVPHDGLRTDAASVQNLEELAPKRLAKVKHVRLVAR